jgi:hypothetical protein
MNSTIESCARDNSIQPPCRLTECRYAILFHILLPHAIIHHVAYERIQREIIIAPMARRKASLAIQSRPKKMKARWTNSWQEMESSLGTPYGDTSRRIKALYWCYSNCSILPITAEINTSTAIPSYMSPSIGSLIS